MKILKTFIIFLFVVMGSIFVIGAASYKTTYNPFTGKLDYVLDESTITGVGNTSAQMLQATRDYYYNYTELIQWVNITNTPIMGNTTSEIIEAVKDTFVNITGDSMTGNLTVPSVDVTKSIEVGNNIGICLNDNCTHFICSNGTHILISNQEAGVNCG